MDWTAPAFVAALLGLAAVVLWMAARRPGGLVFGRVRASGPAELVQRLPLTPQHSLHLIRVEGETLVVLTYPGGAAVSRGRPFSEWMGELTARDRELPR